jgi:enoyl-CoA hydratase
MSALKIEKDGLTTIFTINRPEERNKITKEVVESLRQGFAEFDTSDQRVAIITSAGDEFFSYGADLADRPELWHALPTLGLATDKPVISAVNGACYGGGFYLVVFSDLCVACESAVFWYPEARIGISDGTIATLAGRIPHKVAMEIMLLARQVSAQRAYEMGFVNQVAPRGKTLEMALEMAHDLATHAPLVHRALKRLVTEHILPIGPSERAARHQREVDPIFGSSGCAAGVKWVVDGAVGDPPTYHGR